MVCSKHLPGLVLAAGLAMCIVCTAAAHSFHQSLSEVELNATRSVLEVSMKVVPEDLERALENRVRRQVNLDATDDVDALLLRYLSSTFRVSSDDGRLLPLHFVGKEVDHRAAWLYFEIPFAHRDGRLLLENRILFDLETEQINTVNYRQEDRHATLIFTVDNPKQPLSAH